MVDPKVNWLVGPDPSADLKWGPYTWSRQLQAVRVDGQVESVCHAESIADASNGVRKHLAKWGASEEVKHCKCAACYGYGHVTYLLYGEDLPAWTALVLSSQHEHASDARLPCETCWGSGDSNNPWADLAVVMAARAHSEQLQLSVANGSPISSLQAASNEPSYAERLERMTLGLLTSPNTITMSEPGSSIAVTDPIKQARIALAEIDRIVSEEKSNG